MRLLRKFSKIRVTLSIYLNGMDKQCPNNTLLTLTIVVFLLLTTAGVGYYFFYVLPNQNIAKLELDLGSKREEQAKSEISKEFIFKKNQECQSICSKIYEEDVKKEKEKGGKGIFGNPKYKYNEELNTCLYSSVYIWQGTKDSRVKDCISGETILYSVYDGEIRLAGTYHESYNAQEEQLMK